MFPSTSAQSHQLPFHAGLFSPMSYFGGGGVGDNGDDMINNGAATRNFPSIPQTIHHPKDMRAELSIRFQEGEKSQTRNWKYRYRYMWAMSQKEGENTSKTTDRKRRKNAEVSIHPSFHSIPSHPIRQRSSVRPVIQKPSKKASPQPQEQKLVIPFVLRSAGIIPKIQICVPGGGHPISQTNPDGE